MAKNRMSFFSRGAFYCVPACVVAYLWVFVSGVVSDALSRWNLGVFSAGVLIVVPALFMPFGRGLVVVLLSGILFDVSLPVPFEKMESALGFSGKTISLFGEMSADVPPTLGLTTICLVIFFLAIRFFRARIDARSPRQWLVCALFVNAVVFLLWALAMSLERVASFQFWAGFLVEVFASSVFVVLAGWWLFDAQISAYRLCGIDVVAEREGEE